MASSRLSASDTPFLISLLVARGASAIALLPLYANRYLKSAGGRPTFKDNKSRVLKSIYFTESAWAEIKTLATDVSKLTRYKVSPAQIVAMLLDISMMGWTQEGNKKNAPEVSNRKLPR